MRYKIFLEAKKLKGTMIGYGVKKNNLAKLYDYIGSWLDRFKIPYDKVEKPHFSIAMIPEEVNKDELIRKVQSISKGVTFNPKQISLFRGQRVPKDFIVVEYKPNKQFLDAFYEIAADYSVNWFPGGVKPHTSLFIIPKDKLPQRIFRDMMLSMPKLPKAKADKVELWNEKFQVEFSK